MRRICFAVALAAAVTFSVHGQVIDFEDKAPGTAINAEYGAGGVIFLNAFIGSDPHAHSGTRILRNISPSAEEFTELPLVMRFTGPMTRVAFFAGNLPGITGNGTLKAFGTNNVLLAQDGPKPVPNNAFTGFFEVSVPAGGITRAEFRIAGSPLVTIDDLVVEGTAGPLPTTAPTVTFTSPSEGVVVGPGTIALQGTVTGASLLEPITVRVKRGLPPDSTAPASDNAVALAGSGAARTFSLAYGANVIGPYTVTAIAKNTANLEGTATVHFTVLPDVIRTRYEGSGGAGTLGALSFGSSEGNCRVAVYENGLIAAAGNQTFIVTGNVFTKWMATREPGGSMSRLGCPTAEERDALAGARAQDFRHGRIYVTTNSAAYVPEVFRDAIEVLGGEEATGIATTDPTHSSGAMQTWLFQRFARPNLSSVEPSTLEIRGNPPVLYVERVGEGVERAGNNLTPTSTSATVYRSFPCDGTQGPCRVEIVDDNPLITSCNGMYPFTSDTEWQSITGTYVHTPVRGWVHESRLSCTDNPLTHDYETTNNSSRCSTTDVFPSDWNVYLRPIAPFGGKVTVDQTYFEIEFESYYANYFFAGWGWPIAGDLVFASGRWIMDCGHSPVRAEIHPPYLMSHVNTRKRNDGRLETVAEIWITGYYPGSPIDVDLWPPPRPSPNAILTLTKPLDSDAAFGVNVALTTSFNGARIRFTAPSRQPPIDDSGKMHWMTGRGYEGEWTLYWSDH